MPNLDLTSRQGCRRCRGILLLSTGLLSVAALSGVQPPQPEAGENCVFRVGEFDGSSAEFAPKDATGEERYIIGQNQPTTKWCGFQPAVQSAELADPAQTAAHAQTIAFQIPDAPSAAYRLKVSLLFEQAKRPTWQPGFPALRVTINGKSGVYYAEPKLDYRMGDTVAAQDPVYSTADVVFVFPGTLLHQGLNAIALQAVEDAVEALPGAGFSYDAIELDRWAQGPVDGDTATRIDPTVYFRKRQDGLSELVNVTIRSPRRLSSEDTVSLVLGDHTYQKKLGVSRDFGEARISFEVPEFPAQSVARVQWGAGDARVSAEQKIAPRKKWTLFLVPHIHLDVGFTDYQAKVAVVQAQVIDEAMDLIAKHPDFRFSVDGEWCLEQFLKIRSPRERERVIAAIRDQRLFIPAQYANLLTGLPTAETLIRSLYPSANFSREHQTPFNYANIADVPSYSWSYASILAAAGIKDFVAAAHDHRAPVLMQGRLNEHSPFWWKAPDGQKVLFYYTRSYLQMEMLFGLPPVLAAGIETIPVFLQQYEQPGYRASAAIIYGTQEENRALFPQQAELAGKWNAEWAYPRMEYSGFHDALETIRQQCGDDIPTFSGDGGPYWELGVGSDARYVAMERETEARAASAEKLSTLASLIDPRIAVDKPALDDMWTTMLLMDEHTWDSWYSVTDPDTVTAKEQLAVKDSFAIRAQAAVDSLARVGMATLAGSISAEANSLIVFNTLSWPRSGLVEFDLPKNQELVDLSSGSPVPLQPVRELHDLNHVRFEAANIPALGYKVYQLRASTAAVTPAAAGREATLESPYYRVELDPASGAVRSIYDKELHRELVDQGSDYRFGQYLYVSDTDPAQNQSKTWNRRKLDLQIHPAGNGKIISVIRTPYGWEAKMESTAASTPAIATTLRLFEHQKKIELIEDVDKDAVTAKEAVYFAFPFAISQPQFQYELQTTSMDPAKDMYPGAGHEWFSVQHWVSAQADGVSASLLPIDVPLITLGDIDRGQWLDSFGERRATIFSFAMNNYWEDNYLASQGGRFHFRYVVTSAPSTDEAQLSRLGWAEATPLEFDEVTPQDKILNDARPLDGRQASLAQIADPHVLLETMKPAEDRDGTILRLLDLGGATRPVSIRLPAFRFSGAWQTDAVERNQGPLAVKDGREFTVIMHPHEIVTVRITANGPENTSAGMR